MWSFNVISYTDDIDGYPLICQADVIAARYRILDPIYKGTFYRGVLHIIIYVGDTDEYLLTFKVDILATLHERLILFVSSYRFDLASRLTGLSFDPVSTILFLIILPFYRMNWISLLDIWLEILPLFTLVDLALFF